MSIRISVGAVLMLTGILLCQPVVGYTSIYQGFYLDSLRGWKMQTSVMGLEMTGLAAQNRLQEHSPTDIQSKINALETAHAKVQAQRLGRVRPHHRSRDKCQ